MCVCRRLTRSGDAEGPLSHPPSMLDFLKAAVTVLWHTVQRLHALDSCRALCKLRHRRDLCRSRAFQRFSVEVCRTEAAARKLLTDKGLEHYWDLAVATGAEED